MKMHMKKPEPWVLPVTVVCLALGMLAAFMLRTKLDEYDNQTNTNPIRAIISLQNKNSLLQRDNERIQSDNKKLEEQYKKVIDSIAGHNDQQKIIITELNKLRMLTGRTAVQGPGIVITIDDSRGGSMQPSITPENAAPLLTHDIDLMMLVNELRAAGAEAIELNGQRVAGTTAIRCVGPAIQVNNQPISAPFIVKAIGKTDVLYGAVNLPYGVLDGLRPLGMTIKVSKSDMIRVAALITPPSMDIAKPAPDTSGTEEIK